MISIIYIYLYLSIYIRILVKVYRGQYLIQNNDRSVKPKNYYKFWSDVLKVFSLLWVKEVLAVHSVYLDSSVLSSEDSNIVLVYSN